MKYFITTLIVVILTSLFWILDMKYKNLPISIPFVCNEECQVAKLKKQKELEMRAEMEMISDTLDELLNDDKNIDNRNNQEKEYRLRFEDMNP